MPRRRRIAPLIEGGYFNRKHIGRKIKRQEELSSGGKTRCAAVTPENLRRSRGDGGRCRRGGRGRRDLGRCPGRSSAWGWSLRGRGWSRRLGKRARRSRGCRGRCRGACLRG